MLTKYIIKTLHTVFLYDSQSFLNKDRFETLMQPVVDQLENTVGGIQSLKARATEYIIPCVSQFAVATADDSLWKLLNYQILLKTRHNDAEIRLVLLIFKNKCPWLKKYLPKYRKQNIHKRMKIFKTKHLIINTNLNSFYGHWKTFIIIIIQSFVIYRLIALDCLVAMATQLGSSWLPLLAESVPFLAELLEDGDSRIETSTKDAIRKLEQILGEPLEKYF